MKWDSEKAEVLKALAEPTGGKIQEMLRNGETCIREIVLAINGEQGFR
jgi:DNA-binding transcriptional ArsR family regulator